MTIKRQKNSSPRLQLSLRFFFGLISASSLLIVLCIWVHSLIPPHAPEELIRSLKKRVPPSSSGYVEFTVQELENDNLPGKDSKRLRKRGLEPLRKRGLEPKTNLTRLKPM